MKTIIILFLIALITPHLTFSQTVFSGEQKGVYNTILLIGKAWTENNLDTLSKYIDKEYMHTDVQGQVFKRDPWFNYIKQRKEQGLTNPGLEFEDIDIRVYKDFAVVTGTITLTGAAFTNNDPKDIHKLRFTQVLRKEKHVWKRLLYQATYITNL